jgi:hypothetical protein
MCREKKQLCLTNRRQLRRQRERSLEKRIHRAVEGNGASMIRTDYTLTDTRRFDRTPIKEKVVVKNCQAVDTPIAL